MDVAPCRNGNEDGVPSSTSSPSDSDPVQLTARVDDRQSTQLSRPSRQVRLAPMSTSKPRRRGRWAAECLPSLARLTRSWTMPALWRRCVGTRLATACRLPLQPGSAPACKRLNLDSSSSVLEPHLRSTTLSRARIIRRTCLRTRSARGRAGRDLLRSRGRLHQAEHQCELPQSPRPDCPPAPRLKTRGESGMAQHHPPH